MYRFLLRPKWIAFHLLVLAGVVLMVNLGFWQLRRLDERKDFNAQVAERVEQPVVELAELLPDGTTLEDPAVDEAEWRTVEVEGDYLVDQVVIFNRSQGGRAGSMIVTPLQLADGRVLLVERGFVQLTGDPGAPPPDAPEGEVALTGRLRRSQERRPGGLTDRAEGALAEAQRIDIARLAGQLPGPVVPMYLELVTSEPPLDPTTDPAPVERPSLDEGPHLSYAVQWFIFSLCAVVGWVIAVRRSTASRQRQRRRARPQSTAEPQPAPAAVDADVASPA